MNFRVKEIREALNMTQKEFSESIKMSRSNLAGIENGAVNLREKNIDLICEFHNVNKNWLITGEGEMFVELTEDDELSLLIGKFLAKDDEYKKKIIKTMLSLPDEDWYLIRDLVNKFKD